MALKSVRKQEPTYRYAHVAKSIAKSRPSVDSGMLLAELIEVWGGHHQLAIDLKREYDSAGAGGMTRQRILEMIQRLIITNTKDEIGKPADASDLTDEELQGELLKFVTRFSDGDPGPVA